MPLEGADELLGTLDRLVATAKRQTVSKRGVATMARRAGQLAPRSGEAKDHLADHIVAEAHPDGSIVMGPAGRFFYGRFIEFGTVKMRPRPFMRPAFDEQAGDVIEATSKDVWPALAREGKS